ncbi:hypothetical protein Ocin01_12578 [Orchesella cincta]|uniref:Uncharacterized protein n=1 Tax=Orchesella cincta TaxID=48709 RepID=A0A1D2MMQ5_ORCCI|nr:hypothetical protein Ocin01_12578 [Orchesella cincta]
MNTTLILHLVLTSVIFLIGDCECGSTTFRVFDETARKHFYAERPQFFPGSTQQLISDLAEWRLNNCTRVLQSTKFSKRSTSSQSGLLRIVVSAYNSHTNLVLRPDDIWAAIMTQFSFYVNKNAEEFRGKFVNFEGKKDLTVSLPGSLRNAPYGKLIQLLGKKIDENLVDSEVKDWILPNFSTTTENDRVSIGVVFMATFKKYFDYRIMLSSAIPHITLEGTVEDWKDIQERLEKLKEYNLEQWCNMLYPVIGEFVSAKEGHVDLEFWKRIVHYQGGSGSNQVSGWITVFAVFDKDGSWLVSGQLDKWAFSFNETARKIHVAWMDTFSAWPRFYMSMIPSGIVEVDLKINKNGVEHEAVLFAGHIATEILEDDVTIQPVLSWALALKRK